MNEPRLYDRREFTVASALAMLAGVVITISSCGKDSSASPTSPTSTTPGGSTTDKSGTISANHGHVATITGAQLTAGGALELNIQGTASHPHTVSLSSAELSSIAGNQRVEKASSTNSGHSHTVTFN